MKPSSLPAGYADETNLQEKLSDTELQSAIAEIEELRADASKYQAKGKTEAAKNLREQSHQAYEALKRRYPVYAELKTQWKQFDRDLKKIDELEAELVKRNKETESIKQQLQNREIYATELEAKIHDLKAKLNSESQHTEHRQTVVDYAKEPKGTDTSIENEKIGSKYVQLYLYDKQLSQRIESKVKLKYTGEKLRNHVEADRYGDEIYVSGGIDPNIRFFYKIMLGDDGVLGDLTEIGDKEYHQKQNEISFEKPTGSHHRQNYKKYAIIHGIPQEGEDALLTHAPKSTEKEYHNCVVYQNGPENKVQSIVDKKGNVIFSPEAGRDYLNCENKEKGIFIVGVDGYVDDYFTLINASTGFVKKIMVPQGRRFYFHMHGSCVCVYDQSSGNHYFMNFEREQIGVQANRSFSSSNGGDHTYHIRNRQGGGKYRMIDAGSGLISEPFDDIRQRYYIGDKIIYIAGSDSTEDLFEIEMAISE